jgi:hypothetical protein
MSALSIKPTISVIEWASRLGWGKLRYLLKCRLSHLYTINHCEWTRDAAITAPRVPHRGAFVVLQSTFCRCCATNRRSESTWKEFRLPKVTATSKSLPKLVDLYPVSEIGSGVRQ